MTESAQREPTNESLWAQPPADAPATYPGQSLAPVTPQQHVPTPAGHARPDKAPFVIAIISLAVSVPLTIVALLNSGVPAMIIMWFGLIMINVVFGVLRRPR